MAIDTAGLLAGLVSGYGLYDQYQQLADAGQDYQAAVQPIITQAQENLQFVPYTVTSNLGGTQVSPEGQMTITPSQQLQGIQNQAFGGAQQMFGQALAPQDQRVQDVYSQIRALAAPQEQQQRLATEERLAAQGRLGLQSAQYGGTTPEMLAQEQAIAQARNQAALQAISQAQAEQLQNFNIGQGMLGAGFTPQAQLMNQQQIANQMAQLAITPQTTLANIINNAGIAGIEASQAAEANQMNLLGQLYSGVSGMLGGTTNPVTGQLQAGALTGLANSAGSWFGDFLGGIFGNNNNFNLDAYTPTPFGTITTPAYQAPPPAPSAPSGGFDFDPIGGQSGIYDNYA
jgi:hypothetical protein